MAELLRARGVEIVPDIDAGELPGRELRTAWECFLEMAAEPAYEPFVNDWGTRLRADPGRDGDLLLFEASLSAASGDTPATFGAWFRRQFTFEEDDGEYAGMNAVTLHVYRDDVDALAARPRAALGQGRRRHRRVGRGGRGARRVQCATRHHAEPRALRPVRRVAALSRPAAAGSRPRASRGRSASAPRRARSASTSA